MQKKRRARLDPQLVRALRRAVPALHRWYRSAARDLPWRRTRDPYAIWISEVMLQQTQVATVLPYYRRWIETFPDVTSLARAEPELVLRLWEGLGYYSRARNLLAAAQQVVEHFDGSIPRSIDHFGSLPGVGPYTTAAVLSIAFDLDLAAVDGNVRRVISRLIGLDRDPRETKASHLLEALATQLLPRGRAALHNQAMMELGALVCTPRSPRCDDCPVARPCRARASEEPESYPRRRERKPAPHRHYEVGVVLDGAGALLLDRRPYEGFLGGLWELPKVRSQPGARPGVELSRRLREDFGLTVRKRRRQGLAPVSHAYSHFKATLHPLLYDLARVEPRAAEGRTFRWVDPADLPAISRADQKVLEQWTTRRRRPHA